MEVSKIGFCSSHKNFLQFSLTQFKVFVLKLVSVNRLSTSTIMVSEIASLAHEALQQKSKQLFHRIHGTFETFVLDFNNPADLLTWNHPMKCASLKTKPLFTSTKRAEVFRSLGYHISSAERRSQRHLISFSSSNGPAATNIPKFKLDTSNVFTSYFHVEKD